MSVPFSNTHLRVPRGFGTILEGLAREILRDQPEDIPKYAAEYFDGLLKQREESGMDPAEWAARLEDRFYNNHAFKATETGPEKERATDVTASKEKSHESQAEDESSHSSEASNLSATQPDVSQEADLSKSADEGEEKRDITEKHIISTAKGFSEEESGNGQQAADVQPDVPSGTEEERDPTITTFDQVDSEDNEKDSSPVPDRDIPQSDLEPTDLLSFRGISNVDVCAQEIAMAEDEAGDTQETAAADKEAVEEKNEAEEVFPYSGLADVDVCAAELGGTERTTEATSADDDMLVIEGKSSQSELEQPVAQSSLSQFETTEVNQQEAEENLAEDTNEEGRTETEASSGEIQDSLAHTEGGLDKNAAPNEDSLVEISFEDVPEAQQINEEAGEKQPEEDDSGKVVEMPHREESNEGTVVAPDQNISGTQGHSEPEMVETGQEVNSEGEEMESQHEASDIMQEKVDTDNSNLNDGDDDGEKGEGVKTDGSSHQPTTEADEENLEDETDHKNEDSEKISEGDLHLSELNNPNLKEDETADSAGGDKKDAHTEGHSEAEDQETNDGGAENLSPQVTQSNISTSALEEESETLEAQQVPEETEESQRALTESQLQDTVGEKEATSSEAEEPVEAGKIDSGIQEKSDAMCEEGSIGPIQSADRPPADHQGEERPLGPESDTTEPEGSGDKQEDCSRPQEEEDIMDIPLDDPEANRAAAKIQAGFRGHMTRKKMKPEDKAEGEEVSSTGDVLNGSQGDTETGGSGPVERDDTSVPEQ